MREPSLQAWLVFVMRFLFWEFFTPYNQFGEHLGLIIGFVGIINILSWRRIEEAELELRYGENYRSYRKDIWF